MLHLERQYRRALRWYPRSWRAVNETPLVEVLVDRAEAEHRDRVLPSERLDLVRHGLREHARRAPARLLRSLVRRCPRVLPVLLLVAAAVQLVDTLAILPIALTRDTSLIADNTLGHHYGALLQRGGAPAFLVVLLWSPLWSALAALAGLTFARRPAAERASVVRLRRYLGLRALVAGVLSFGYSLAQVPVGLWVGDAFPPFEAGSSPIADVCALAGVLLVPAGLLLLVPAPARSGRRPA